ncbi:hypothetical protein GPECTOR_4g553 [Gonium pectorale]|uniref:Uncharacterized protein n=1 Tax=Gonium pectorale TaxID=33097 RepID=A0A150GXS4_GONPE|nr:hypothetical protein GPECTOR_4g553 [Gonium pectorale]|eukprot:KXZ54488.1 hypothetical protein GPECTOR_4g553 [Gonium pectorale]
MDGEASTGLPLRQHTAVGVPEKELLAPGERNSYMALGAPSMSTTLAALMCCSGAGALSDVVVDSMVVERARDEQQDSSGSLQSLCWASYAVGQVATAAVSGSIVQCQGPKLVFALTAAFPLLIGAASLLVHEERSMDGAAEALGPEVPQLTSSGSHGSDTSDSSRTSCISDNRAWRSSRGSKNSSHSSHSSNLGRSMASNGHERALSPQQRLAELAASASAARASLASHGSALWSALSAPSIAGPVSFLVLLSATPSADDAVFFWQVETLGFTPAFLGGVQLAGALASLAGVVLYQTLFKTVPLRSLLMWGTLLGVLLRSTDLLLVTRANTYLGLDDHLFVLGGSVMTQVIANVMAMPTLVLAARLCPKGLEATMFATLMSLLNMAEAVRFAGGAVLMGAFGVGGEAGSFEQLPALVALCDAAMLLPLPLLARVPVSLDADAAAEAGPAEAAEVPLEAGTGAVEAIPVPVPVAAVSTTASSTMRALQPGVHSAAAQRRYRRRQHLLWRRLHAGEGGDAWTQLLAPALPEAWPGVHGQDDAAGGRYTARRLRHQRGPQLVGPQSANGPWWEGEELEGGGWGPGSRTAEASAIAAADASQARSQQGSLAPLSLTRAGSVVMTTNAASNVYSDKH